MEKAVRDMSLYLDLMLVHAGLKFEGSVAMCVCGPVGVLCVREIVCVCVSCTVWLYSEGCYGTVLQRSERVMHYTRDSQWDGPQSSWRPRGPRGQDEQD